MTSQMDIFGRNKMSYLWILSRDWESSNKEAVIILKYSVYNSSKAGLHEVKAWLEVLGRL